ncbi:hypothetical protein QE109_16535 [Fusibacter bizertensis]|uniref:Uncharacterized protein n=1 Tax=Fusibacter bizertensis TaxID=1488331 RepID=A0ABT6NHA4_9FIRM|nr:hypothetical protein [Fusibacter bizertensis]MDH8679767.1 hypothetical protein [Fusibacter bizertensis]
MKKYKHTFILGILLIGLSAALHALHYLLFKDLHHIMVFLVSDLAFIPLEVFFVSVVLERIIEKRDERVVAKKHNMLIGLFYQEIGNFVLNHFVKSDRNIQNLEFKAQIDFKWDTQKYDELKKCISAHKYAINMSSVDLKSLDEALTKHKELIVNLISNPTIHEHGQFSEVLMSLFHLADELKVHHLDDLVQSDLDHIQVDSERVYHLLAMEWVSYMSHMQVDYPYLFLTAVKNNPFDFRTSEIKELEALKTY